MKRIKAVVKGRSNDEGFGLAVSVGFSLVAIMIGLTIVGRSMKDSGVSAAQQTTSRSFSTAEAGVTRYLSLINSDRHLAKYSDCKGTRNASGVCPDTGTGDDNLSWSNPAEIPASSCSASTTRTTDFSNAVKNRTWQNLGTDSSKGQYRIVSYTYTPGASASVPGIGSLIVDGRTDRAGSSNISGNNNDLALGITRVKVDIPVRQDAGTLPPFPGLWIQGVGIKNINNQIDANVLVSCDTSPTDLAKFTNVDSITGTDTPMPDLPDVPPSIPNNLNSINGQLTIPRSSDTPDSKIVSGVSVVSTPKTYRYRVSSMSKGTELSVKTTDASGPVKVILYLGTQSTDTGNINLGGGDFIRCVNNAGTVIPICGLTDFQIYGYKPASASPEICTGGTGYIDSGFIFARDYRVGVKGSGNNDGFTGSIWADSWAVPGDGGSGCGSATSQLVLTQTTSGWTDIAPYITSPIPPKLDAPSNWKIQPYQS
jgi:Tfp pilus assembly protein PilX